MSSVRTQRALLAALFTAPLLVFACSAFEADAVTPCTDCDAGGEAGDRSEDASADAIGSTDGGTDAEPGDGGEPGATTLCAQEPGVTNLLCASFDDQKSLDDLGLVPFAKNLDASVTSIDAVDHVSAPNALHVAMPNHPGAGFTAAGVTSVSIPTKATTKLLRLSFDVRFGPNNGITPIALYFQRTTSAPSYLEIERTSGANATPTHLRTFGVNGGGVQTLLSDVDLPDLVPSVWHHVDLKLIVGASSAQVVTTIGNQPAITALLDETFTPGLTLELTLGAIKASGPHPAFDVFVDNIVLSEKSTP